MKTKNFFLALVVISVIFAWGCKKTETGTSTPTPTAKPARPNEPAALPDNGFKAVIEIPNAPTKLRTGQKETIQVKVKNGSDVMWYARGAAVNTNPGNKFYLAAGNRWLTSSEQLVTDMDGRYGLNKDLRPGEETEVPLLITAPKEPGDYVLEVDIVQEQVAWFHDKGSPTAKVKVTVVR